MANNKYEMVMDILERESNMEIECAIKTRDLMMKTLNPIRKCKLWFSYKMFSSHATGINLAIRSIKRELGE